MLLEGIQTHLRKTYLGDGWWDMERYWDRLSNVARRIDDQKLHYASRKPWSKHNTSLVGLLGEKAFSLETGLPMNLKVQADGDRGWDFEYAGMTFDVKSTSHAQPSCLPQHTDTKPDKLADYYLLAVVDFDRRRSRIVGWTEKDRLLKAPIGDLGYGPKRCLPVGELVPGLPAFLPSTRSLLGISTQANLPTGGCDR